MKIKENNSFVTILYEVVYEYTKYKAQLFC
jgi:hypothetical protein